MTNPLTDHCPVCGMRVRSAQFSAEYHKMFFHFCSQECLERFEATPQLAENHPPLIKQRHLLMAERYGAAKRKVVEDELMAMMGVSEVKIEELSIHITYNLLQINQLRIEQRLSGMGVSLDESLKQRFLRGLVHTSEENEIGNLASAPRACCSRYPSPP